MDSESSSIQLSSTPAPLHVNVAPDGNSLFLRNGDELPQSPSLLMGPTTDKNINNAIKIDIVNTESSAPQGTPVNVKPRAVISAGSKSLNLKSSVDSPLKNILKTVDWNSYSVKNSSAIAFVQFQPNIRETFLGEGRFAHVYKGTVSVPSRSLIAIPCAVKRLKSDLEEDDLSLVWTEISMLTSLQGSRNIIRLITLVEARNLKGPYFGDLNAPIADDLIQDLFLEEKMNQMSMGDPSHGPMAKPPEWMVVTELAEHGDLYGLLKRKPHLFSLTQIKNWTRQIASGLDSIHQLGIIHHDIKPQNILISGDGLTAKITDFGNACWLQHGEKLVDGLGRGTTAYTAPEILSTALDRRYDHSVDIYSLGVTLYVMLTGEDPFAFASNSNSVSMILAVKKGFWSCHRPPGHHGDVATLPCGEKIWNVDEESIFRCLLSCTVKEPSDRPSASEIMNSL